MIKPKFKARESDLDEEQRKILVFISEKFVPLEKNLNDKNQGNEVLGLDDLIKYRAMQRELAKARNQAARDHVVARAIELQKQMKQ